ATEVAAKEARVQAFLREQRLEAVFLAQYRNYSWVTGGSEDTIVMAAESGPVTLVLTRDGSKYALCANDEEARNRDEELAGLGYEMISWEWFHNFDATSPQEEFARSKGWEPAEIGSDMPVAWATDVAKQFAPLRFALTEPEMKKYRWLGRECTEACTETCREIRPGMTEKQIQRVIADKLMARGITPTVLLIAVDGRLFQHRHAIATDRKLEKYAQVNICARKWGLVIAVTRYVHFGPIPAELGHRLRACARVTGAFLSALKPGVTAGEVFQAGIEMYARTGFPDEWRQHHQGGATGYAEREWVTFPGDPTPIVGDQAFAFNPTIMGAKVEDTVILHADGTLENVTQTLDWPNIPIALTGPAAGQTYYAPSILVRH
ncbi:MAG TPA: M24 family metallopeptidase, partial [Armatimonadota bacterium]|nr:M24 family metallopeptidase [Armatimonadota bacterium]